MGVARHFLASLQELDLAVTAVQAADVVGLELRSQYVLGYPPSNLPRAGKYQRVRMKVLSPSGPFRAELGSFV